MTAMKRGQVGVVWMVLMGGVLQGQLTRWEGPEVATEGWVDTGNGFLGWLWCGEGGDSPWVYPLALGQYVYLPADYATEAGGWGYLPRLAGIEKRPLEAYGSGWYGLNGLDGAAYLGSEVEGDGRGWLYMANTGLGLPLGPAPLAVRPWHVEEVGASNLAERFARSLRLSAGYIRRFAETDADIYQSSVPGGVTFLNPLLIPGGNSNRRIRVGVRDGEGLLDFSSLAGISGEARLGLRADVDLSQTTNGFYVRVKRGETEVAANERLDSGRVYKDILLEPYLTMAHGEAYVEVTLPWQSELTIKEIFLSMDTRVRGFADMEARISGGSGASAENTHRVHNAAELVTALERARAAQAPTIIEVAGAITYADWVAAGQSGREASIGGDLRDMSIIGMGTSGLFDGVGILVQGENVIIQNLTMRYVLARDAIQVNNGRYVKIDHCTLYNESFDINPDKDKFDELISIKNNASHVIVSWNEIYNSHKTILVGSNDEVDALPDRKVIFHHNWFHDTGSRHPLYRGGHAHVYNNYYQRVNSAIDVRTNAKVLIENNHFEDVRGSIGYSSDYSGGIEVRGNLYIRVGGTIRTQSTLDIQFAGEYVYTLDPVEAVPDIVRAGAGVGKLPY
jgi:pectate lyase